MTSHDDDIHLLSNEASKTSYGNDSEWESVDTDSEKDIDFTHFIDFVQPETYCRPHVYTDTKHISSCNYNTKSQEREHTAEFDNLDLKTICVSDWVENHMPLFDSDSENEEEHQNDFCTDDIPNLNFLFNDTLTIDDQCESKVAFVKYEDPESVLLEEKVDHLNIPIYPIVSVTIGDTTFSAILDSGSPISVLNEKILSKHHVFENFPTLPLTSTKIRGVIAGKAIVIRRQMRIDFICQNHQFSANLLIVPNITTQLILGIDFLTEYQMTLNFGEAYASALVNNQSVKLKFEDLIIEREDSVKYMRPFFSNHLTDNVIPDNDITDSYFEAQRDEFLSETIEKKLSMLKGVSCQDRKNLSSILHEFSHVFDNAPGTIKNFVYEFEVKDHKPFFVPPYPIPLIYKDRVKTEIKMMLENRVIEPAVSPYNSPLHVVEKKDKSIRLVLDSRKINTIILPETDRPQTLEELLQKFHGVKVMSTLDLRSSFWQVMLHPNCRKFTAFLCYGNCFQFRKLPFGLKISSSAFIRAMDSILPDSLKQRITTYVDDILIAENSWEEHNFVLHSILQVFSDSGVTVNLEKSQFGQSQIKFLGHIISGEGIRPDPDQLDAIEKMPTPTTRKQLRGFLGLINFYRRFIQVKDITTPRLYQLTGKNTLWFWDDDAQKQFLSLKNALIKAPILHHPNLSRVFCISTDSSKFGLGVHVFQEYEENDTIIQKTIAFASRILTKAERNYSVTELEALAVVWAFEKFRFYLFGRHTKVYTDHRALQFLMTAKLNHDRLRRWALFLQQFDFSVIHIPGKENTVADCLSRSPIGLVKATEEAYLENNFSILYMRKVAFENYIASTLKDIAKEQDKDPIWKDIKVKWHNKFNVSIRQFYTIHNNILFKRRSPDSHLWLLCFPEESVNKLIWYTHLSYGHYGAKKCFTKLRDSCYFLNMEKRIRKVLSQCKLCQKAKPPTVTHAAPLFPIIPEKLKEFAAVDLFGPLPRTRNGFSFIFVAVELTSKFVSFTPLRRATAKSVSWAFVKNFLKEVKHVDKVISDNGAQFRSKLWLRTLRRRKIKPVFVSLYHAASNPSERCMKELGKLCRMYCYRQHNTWDEYLKSFQDIINELPNDSTGLPPILVLKNRQPPDRIRELVIFPKQRQLRYRDIIQLAITNIRKAAEKRKDSRKKFTVKQLYVGQKVLVKSHRLSHKGTSTFQKFFLLYNGPYRVKKIIHNNAVEVETLRTRKSKGVHHISNIKVFKM